MHLKPTAESLRALRSEPAVILPSLLGCDFGNLQREIAALEAAGVQALHLDVMDGHFVPNFTYGMTIVTAVRKLTQLPLDVHLMMSAPQKYLKQFADAGADCLTIHAEIDADLPKTLKSIRELGLMAGLALNPAPPPIGCAHLVGMRLVANHECRCWVWRPSF